MFDDIMLSSLLEHEKNVLLLFDVMKTKSGLVFKRFTWRLVAFTDLGDVNDEFDDFNKFIKQGFKEPDQAAYVLTLLVCGLFKYLNYPVGYFAWVGFDSAQLCSVFWEYVGTLEGLGIHFRAFVSDGASTNRRFFCLHECTHKKNVLIDGVVYWTWNRINKGENFFLISDPPHLIEALENNLENSHGNHNTRNLIVSVFLRLILSFFLLHCKCVFLRNV